jgi:hypothetical protein
MRKGGVRKISKSGMDKGKRSKDQRRNGRKEEAG